MYCELAERLSQCESSERDRLVVAVEELLVHVELLDAERPYASDDTVGYAEASIALFNMSRLARSLELAGMEVREIQERFVRFRRVISKSPLALYLQTWPRGYQGDFEVIEYILDGCNRATPGTFSWHLERAVLHSGIVQQHRYKIRRQTEEFIRTLGERGSGCRIVSLGCGGCRDLQAILPLLRDFAGEIVLNDIDPSALSIAQSRLSSVTNHVRVLQMNVLQAVRMLKEGEGFDLVIAGGLFDYIPDRLASLVLRMIYTRLLKPSGRCLFTNLGNSNMFLPWMNYAVNWNLLERSELQLREVCTQAGIPQSRVSIETDESGMTYIVRVLAEPEPQKGVDLSVLAPLDVN